MPNNNIEMPIEMIEIKYGHWEEVRLFDGCDCWGREEYKKAVKCSKCGHITEFKENFCPNCGAMMKK